MSISAYAGTSDTGRKRRRNEDSLYAGSALFAVADGLGGHAAGDVASAVTIEALRPYDKRVSPAELPTILGRAVAAANDAIRHRIAAEPALMTKGSTLVALMWSETTACLGNLGDSRAYLLRRPAGMRQLTEDHNFAHLVAEADAVRDLPERLARWVDGRPGGRSPDIAIHRLHAGDRWLLCSDGLSSYVSREAIEEALDSAGNANEAADLLVELALAAGAPDNVTVVVVDFADALPAD